MSRPIRFPPTKRLEEVREDISCHLEEIAENFKKPIKITIIVRSVDFPDGSRDLLMTDDDLSEAIAAIKKIGEKA